MSTRRHRAAPRNVKLSRSAPVFAALGDETRLQLVTTLCTGGPTSIARLTVGTNVTRQAVTKHLRVLADAGLVRSVRQGRESVWELEPQQLAEARRWLDSLSVQWNDVLARLKLAVED